MKSLLSIKLVALMAMAFLSAGRILNAGGKTSPVDRIIREFNKPDSNQIMVIAHRADWRNHPENSISSIKSCIKMGVDIVELDVRKTKDGVFVLMHDGSVNRTTNGKGAISSMTLSEAKKLRLKHKGKVTDEQIPTLEEALKVSKGKIMINVDKAGISKELLKLIKKTGTMKQILFKGGASVESINKVLASSKEAKSVHFMPVVTRGGYENIEKYFKMSTRPKAVELIFGDINSPFNTAELLKKCRDKGLRTWVNTLWASLCAGQTDAKAVKDPDKIWGELIKKGYNMIQTDNPEELLQYLRKKGLHKFDDRKPARKKKSQLKEAA